MTKHNEAIAHLIKTGNETAAFAIALQDEGINEGVTLEAWIAFAKDCVARREDEKLVGQRMEEVLAA